MMGIKLDHSDRENGSKLSNRILYKPKKNPSKIKSKIIFLVLKNLGECASNNQAL